MIKTFTNPEINNQNTYLVINKNQAVLIDACSQVINALEYLKEHNITLQAIIITHGHYDHINGLNDLLHQYPEIDLYINQEDFHCLTDSKYNLSNLRYPNGFTVTEKIKNLHLLSEEITNLVLINYHFIIKHIFGHTYGSQYIIIKELNAIFVGDTIFYDKIGFYELPYSDAKAFKNSLLEILTLPLNYDVYPGHHQKFKLHEVITHNEILKEFIQKK